MSVTFKGSAEIGFLKPAKNEQYQIDSFALIGTSFEYQLAMDPKSVRVFIQKFFLCVSHVMGCLTLSLSAFASNASHTSSKTLDSTYGYTSDIQTERENYEEPIHLYLPGATPPVASNVHAAIFDGSISNELVSSYNDRFGRTESEQTLRIFPSSTVYTSTQTGGYYTTLKTSEDQKIFGEFMFRRLTEYHVDKFSKNDERARPIYQLKEKISKVEVQVSPGMSITANYSYSGQFVDLLFKSKWVHIRTRSDYSQGPGGGLLGSKETILFLNKDLTSTFSLESIVYYADATVRLIGRKILTPSLSTSISAGTYFSNGPSQRQHLILTGLSWVF